MEFEEDPRLQERIRGFRGFGGSEVAAGVLVGEIIGRKKGRKEGLVVVNRVGGFCCGGFEDEGECWCWQNGHIRFDVDVGVGVGAFGGSGFGRVRGGAEQLDGHIPG